MAREPSPDFLYFKLGEERNPEFLRKVLTAHFNYERMRTVRRFFVAVVAVLSLGLWLAAVWPGGISKHTRSVGLELWCLCTMTTVIVGCFEFRWYRRREQLRRDL